jgi:CDP-glucose 4,6-dehydratase
MNMNHLNLNSQLQHAFAGAYAGKRVLLTGHTGFKGSWMAQWLAALGAEVVGFARDPLPHETLYDQANVASLLKEDIRGDLADRDLLASVVARVQPDFVFHLAAQPLVRLSYDIPIETFATNVMGTIHVLDALRRAAKHPLKGGVVEALSGDSPQPLNPSSPQPPRPVVAVMITTDKCYENREWLHSYREEDAMGGHDPYSASKGMAELAIASYRNSFFEPTHATSTSDLNSGEAAIRVASARAGNVIGGGDWAMDRIVPDCFRAIRNGQSIPVRNKIATRPWQHVLEPISGYLWLGAALAHPERLGYPTSAPFRGAFNFGPTLTSNRTVAQLVEELLKHATGKWEDRSDPHAPHEASKLNLAVDKAFHLLAWQPVWNFESTLANTASWYVRDAAGEPAATLCQEQIAAYITAAKSKDLPWAS